MKIGSGWKSGFADHSLSLKFSGEKQPSVSLRSEHCMMSTDKEAKQVDSEEARAEALTESELPGQVLDPLAGPAGSRGTQYQVTSEYDEEDARERPPEDGLSPDIPEDENLHVSTIQDFEEELDDPMPNRHHSIERGDEPPHPTGS
jgi:hypothetical protein